MKVAIFRKILDGNFSFNSILTDDEVTPDSLYAREYTQMTEWVGVTFKELPPSIVVAGQLAQLDAAEQELRNKFAQKLSDLADQRAKLKSLTHEGVS